VKAALRKAHCHQVRRAAKALTLHPAQKVVNRQRAAYPALQIAHPLIAQVRRAAIPVLNLNPVVPAGQAPPAPTAHPATPAVQAQILVPANLPPSLRVTLPVPQKVPLLALLAPALIHSTKVRKKEPLLEQQMKTMGTVIATQQGLLILEVAYGLEVLVINILMPSLDLRV
jgi:hypothetical protein